jgi:hypothetical protein
MLAGDLISSRPLAPRIARETSRRLDEAGIAHAGAGETLARARAPRYVETEYGRVGLVSAYAAHTWDNDAALDQFGEVPARPGLSMLRYARTVTTAKVVVDGLRDAYRLIYPSSPGPGDGDLTLFDTIFVEGEATAVRYATDPADVAEVLRSVRLGAQHSDLLIVSLHVHEEEGSTARVAADDRRPRRLDDCGRRLDRPGLRGLHRSPARRPGDPRHPRAGSQRGHRRHHDARSAEAP